MNFKQLLEFLVNNLLTFEFIIKKMGFTRIIPFNNIKKSTLSISDINAQILDKIHEPELSTIFKDRFGNPEVHLFKPRTSYIISSAVVSVKSGLTYVHGNQILRESSSWPINEIIEDKYNGSSLFPLIPKRKYNTSLYATVLSSQGFYHWLIEDLPRYLFLRENSIVPFMTLVCRSRPKYVSDLIKMLDIEFEETPRVVFVPSLLAAGKNPETGYPNPTDLQILKKSLQKQSRDSIRSKIYVTRQTSSRSPKWEPDLSRELLSDGWQIVFAERLSLEEQIQLFAGASHICGIHGAGLSNMVWARKGTKVIEISQEFRSNCFSNLSISMMHEYHRIDSGQKRFSEVLDAVRSIY